MLVSVVVVTYNSELTIIDTLDSIKNQTYRDIELIISDDCSSDNTIKLCKIWAEDNRGRFNDIFIRVSERNGGIGDNVQKGIEVSTGQFIKPIAGDDILTIDCIEKNLECLNKNNYDVLFSNEERFTDDNGKRLMLGKVITNNDARKFKFTKRKLLKEVLTDNFFPAPSAFYRRSAIEDNGGFSTDYTLLEDYPMWINLLNSCCKIGYMDEVTVYYRISPKSLSQGRTDKKVYNIRYEECKYRFYKDRIKPILIKNKYYLVLIHNEIKFFIAMDVIKRGNTSNDYTFMHNLLWKVDPINVRNKFVRYYYNKIKS